MRCYERRVLIFADTEGNHTIYSELICFVCVEVLFVLFVLRFMAQSIQRGHVKHGQFT